MPRRVGVTYITPSHAAGSEVESLALKAGLMRVLASSTHSRRHFAELLAEARARTILLVSPLSDEEILIRPDSAVLPVLSELERILRMEEQLLVSGSDQTPQDDHVPTPQLSSYDEWFDAMMDLRQRSLERLEAADEPGPAETIGERCHRLLEHEYCRGEAILETVQLLPDPYRAPRSATLPRGRRLADPGIMARFPGGAVEIGAALDSPVSPEEETRRLVTMGSFWIDVTPVTNGDFITFMAAGGYMRADFWSEAGWNWLRSSGAKMPLHWIWEDGGWWTRWMDRPAPLNLTCAVGPVCYYEAEAFARFAGKRLPTGLEWEAAATWDPETQSRRNFPWGNMPPTPNVANLDQLAFEPAAVGAFPGNLSPIGCYGMIGDLWEWTSGDLSSGNALRGGSWATRPGAVRTTVRKAAATDARHVFSGFRCAHDG